MRLSCRVYNLGGSRRSNIGGISLPAGPADVEHELNLRRHRNGDDLDVQIMESTSDYVKFLFIPDLASNFLQFALWLWHCSIHSLDLFFVLVLCLPSFELKRGSEKSIVNRKKLF